MTRAQKAENALRDILRKGKELGITESSIRKLPGNTMYLPRITYFTFPALPERRIEAIAKEYGITITADTIAAPRHRREVTT